MNGARMVYKNMRVLFVVSLFVALKLVRGDCVCKEPTLLYETLKCQPLYASPDDCCPKQFDCSHVENRDTTNCHFKGKAYRVGEHIDDDEIYGNCFIDCTCIGKRSGGKAFGCANLDCAESLGLKPPENCLFKYQLNKCCSIGETCPPFDIKCKVNGKIYKDGERFTSPDNKCIECVCQDGFKGKYEPPFCKRRECLEEITNALNVKNFCAPSYTSADECCPRQWICPGTNDHFESSKRPAKKSDPKCRFGEKKINIGDKFEKIHSSSGGKLSCECRIPPYLTCYQDKSYPVYIGDYQ